MALANQRPGQCNISPWEARKVWHQGMDSDQLVRHRCGNEKRNFLSSTLSSIYMQFHSILLDICKLSSLPLNRIWRFKRFRNEARIIIFKGCCPLVSLHFWAVCTSVHCTVHVYRAQVAWLLQVVAWSAHAQCSVLSRLGHSEITTQWDLIIVIVTFSEDCFYIY